MKQIKSPFIFLGANCQNMFACGRSKESKTQTQNQVEQLQLSQGNALVE